MSTKTPRFAVANPKVRARHLKRLKLLARHPFAVPVVTILLLIVITGGLVAVFNRGGGDTISPNLVVVSHDGLRQTVSSTEPTVGDLIDKLELAINPGDVVEPAISTAIQQDDFRINIYRASPVTIIDGNTLDYTSSAATTPRAVARQAGLTIYAEDGVTMKPVTDFVKDNAIGQELVVERSSPINLNLYGAALATRTRATTVRGLLAEKKVKLEPQDVVKPALDTSLAVSGPVTVVRNGVTTRTVQEDIPMPTQTITDNNLAYGSSAVRQQGAAGKRAVTYQINTQNGTEISRTAIQTTVLQQPVTQIVVQGSNLSGIKGDMALAGIAPGDYQYVDYIISHESGWCPTKAQGQYGGCPAFSGTVPTSGGYGLCQSTPPQKMASAGADWQTNPVTQLKWCSDYAQRRYGSWKAAYDHWLVSHNW